MRKSSLQKRFPAKDDHLDPMFCEVLVGLLQLCNAFTMRVAVVGSYVAFLLGMMIVLNADAENGRMTLLVWTAVSFAVGWLIRQPLMAILPLLAIPIAVPFGYADEWAGSDAPLLYLGMAFQAPIQAVIVALGFGGHRFFESIRARIG